MAEKKNSLTRECGAEVLGTFILILVGDGAGAVDVFTGALGIWGVSMLWGLAVTLAVWFMFSLLSSAGSWVGYSTIKSFAPTFPRVIPRDSSARV